MRKRQALAGHAGTRVPHAWKPIPNLQQGSDSHITAMLVFTIVSGVQAPSLEDVNMHYAYQ